MDIADALTRVVNKLSFPVDMSNSATRSARSTARDRLASDSRRTSAIIISLPRDRDNPVEGFERGGFKSAYPDTFFEEAPPKPTNQSFARTP